MPIPQQPSPGTAELTPEFRRARQLLAVALSALFFICVSALDWLGYSDSFPVWPFLALYGLWFVVIRAFPRIFGRAPDEDWRTWVWQIAKKRARYRQPVPVVHEAASVAATSAGRRVALIVDVDALPAAERGIATVVHGAVHAVIQAGGYELTDNHEGATVLRVRLLPLEVGDRNYEIHSEFVEGGTTTPAIERTDCVFCSDARMRQKIAAAKRDLLAAIEKQQHNHDQNRQVEDRSSLLAPL